MFAKEKNISWFTAEKILMAALFAVGCAAFILLFIVKDLGGDDVDIYWRFNLIKTHLANDFTMPYFTPGRCGGFHLAADAQDLMFTAYMLMAFLIPNIPWAVKITTFLLSVFLALGIYQWLKYFGIMNRVVRLFIGLLVPMCGYWVYHMVHSGHLWAHGLAYLPWIMINVEEIFKAKAMRSKESMKRMIFLVVLFFLLINSGYYWLQVALPVIGIRILVEILLSGRGFPAQAKKVGIIVLLGMIAILLSWPRLGGVWEFQLTKFPRMGGEVPLYQVMGSIKRWKLLFFRSLFNGTVIKNAFHCEFLGPFWEYTDFIGKLAIVPLGLSLFRIVPLFRSKSFIAIFFAGWYQHLFTHSGEFIGFIRGIFPLLKQVSWHWRGSIIWVLLFGVLMAAGYELLFNQRRKIFTFFAFFLMLASLGEIMLTHFTQMDFTLKPSISVIGRDINPPPKPYDGQYTPCRLSYIFGYGNDSPPQYSVRGNSVYESPQPGYFNMHDVRSLASPTANKGYYFTHTWPLWPETDREEFEKFLNYKQVVPLPAHLRFMITMSIVVWVIFLFSAVKLFIIKRQDE